MTNSFHVSIGIQARSTSTRLPNKISQLVGNKTVISHVIDACRSAASQINGHSHITRMTCDIFLLIPKGDPIKTIVLFNGDYIIEGSEADVLSRYVEMSKASNATHIVRITADCPLIPPFLISSCVTKAFKNSFDYFSNVGNVGDAMRTSIDGHDVEVMTLRALDYADQTAVGREREHVTSVLRSDMTPDWLRRGILIGHNDLSSVKLSIDTQEDLERVREEYKKIQNKITLGQRKYGKTSVHRY